MSGSISNVDGGVIVAIEQIYSFLDQKLATTLHHTGGLEVRGMNFAYFKCGTPFVGVTEI